MKFENLLTFLILVMKTLMLLLNNWMDTFGIGEVNDYSSNIGEFIIIVD